MAARWFSLGFLLSGAVGVWYLYGYFVTRMAQALEGLPR